jgi:hypothetical protein
VLVILEGALILREQYNCEAVDFAFAYDNDGGAINPVFPSVTAENVATHVSSLLAVLQINPYLGSLLSFSSKAALLSFAADDTDRYIIWPSPIDFIVGEYPYFKVFNELVYPYFQSHGRVPPLTCRPYLRTWEKAFFRACAGGRVPIVVLFRNNKMWGTDRDRRG